MKAANLFLFNRILCSPLEAIYVLLIFIASKDLNASLLQLAILASLKAAVSFFAFYISSFIHGKPQLIRKYLITLNLISSIPCLLFPYVENVWFYVIAYGVYMLGLRAIYPAWIEILKRNLDLKTLGSVISKGTSITYLITIFLPLLLSYWMDKDPHIWKSLFFILALLQILNIFVIARLPLFSSQSTQKGPKDLSKLFSPLREGWKLLINRKDFVKYQLLFFFGGAGILLIQPVLPVFFSQGLRLSYQELTLAISFCKGISFILTSPFWARFANNNSIYILNGFINISCCLFIAFMLASEINISWLFLAYLMYGTMQAGCELSWNLSGPLFSKECESSPYSSVNLACIGIRGFICPFVGQLIFSYSNFTFSFALAGLVCLLGVFYAFYLDYSLARSNSQSSLKRGWL